jgi:hypothetical protein
MGRAPQERRLNGDNGLGQAKATEEIDWEFYDLEFAVQRSRRYHEKLSAFYLAWRDRMRMVTAIAGSGAFILVVADSKWGVALSGFVALWAVLDIIVAPDKKAELHGDLCKKFVELARRMATASPDELGALSASRLLIEENEPPCKRLVDLEARNDECRARGFPPDELVPLSLWQRKLGRYFDFGLERLEQWKADRQRVIT